MAAAQAQQLAALVEGPGRCPPSWGPPGENPRTFRRLFPGNEGCHGFLEFVTELKSRVYDRKIMESRIWIYKFTSNWEGVLRVLAAMDRGELMGFSTNQ